MTGIALPHSDAMDWNSNHLRVAKSHSHSSTEARLLPTPLIQDDGNTWEYHFFLSKVGHNLHLITWSNP